MVIMMDLNILWAQDIVTQVAAQSLVSSDAASRVQDGEFAQEAAVRAEFWTEKMPIMVELRNSIETLGKLIAYTTGPEAHHASHQVTISNRLCLIVAIDEPSKFATQELEYSAYCSGYPVIGRGWIENRYVFFFLKFDVRGMCGTGFVNPSQNNETISRNCAIFLTQVQFTWTAHTHQFSYFKHGKASKTPFNNFDHGNVSPKPRT